MWKYRRLFRHASSAIGLQWAISFVLSPPDMELGFQAMYDQLTAFYGTHGVS